MSAWLEAFFASLLRWPDGYVRKVGNKLETAAGGGGGGSLAGLTDVAIASPINGQVLTYNAVSSKWVNATPAGGGGGSGLAFTRFGPIVSDPQPLPAPSVGTFTKLDYV